MNALARGLLVLTLAVGVLGFGVIGMCGGYFTLWALTGQGAPFLILSLPSLLGGLFMVWICARKIVGMLGKPQQQEDAS